MDILKNLLTTDLDFHDKNSTYASHNFHSFPAKFPPQLPKKFIESLTKQNDIVLDPMMGSGTTILEAYLANRQSIGCDIDPLAILLGTVKTTPLNSSQVNDQAEKILSNARQNVEKRPDLVKQNFQKQYDQKSHKFIDFWFNEDTQIELFALLCEINRVENLDLRRFFTIAFSSTIIARSGGVSLALDLAHTRPHRAKVVYDANGNQQFIGDHLSIKEARTPYQTKRVRSAFNEFGRRVQSNLNGLQELTICDNKPRFCNGNANSLPLKDESVDLIVTSPPYASNAIDYMRAHKFSLVWLGYPIKELGQKRKDYIGSYSYANYKFLALPEYTESIVKMVDTVGEKKGDDLRRYYSEMTSVMKEMFRVLKRSKVAVLVVGTSVLGGINTRTDKCLKDIGESIGFHVLDIQERDLDPKKRMLPTVTEDSEINQIQRRMHKEYIIAMVKSR